MLFALVNFVLYYTFMDMKDQLKEEIRSTFGALVEVLGAFTEKELDQIPYEGSWTAGQVAEHIVKFLGNVEGFLNKDVAPTIDRPYDAKCGVLRKIFLDFSLKMKSPDFILPESAVHDKETIIRKIPTLEQQLLDAVENMDLTLTCQSFELPNMGFLTRMEWLTFFVVHTQRHIHQLRNISKALQGK